VYRDVVAATVERRVAVKVAANMVCKEVVSSGGKEE